MHVKSQLTFKQQNFSWEYSLLGEFKKRAAACRELPSDRSPLLKCIQDKAKQLHKEWSP